MEYSVNDLSRLSGLSARTLRYYDEIGLLEPQRNELNNYRVYSAGL
jgi:DNA-binding transcriptional MerR regulator